MFNLMSHVKFNPINDYNIQNLVCLIFAKLAKQAKPSYTILESNDNFYMTQAMDYIQKIPFKT